MLGWIGSMSWVGKEAHNEYADKPSGQIYHRRTKWATIRGNLLSASHSEPVENLEEVVPCW